MYVLCCILFYALCVCGLSQINQDQNKSLRGNRFVSTASYGKQRIHMDLGKQQQTTAIDTLLYAPFYILKKRTESVQTYFTY